MPLTRNVISGWFAFGYDVLGYLKNANDHLGATVIHLSLTAQPQGVCDLSCVSHWPWNLDDNGWQIPKALIQSSIQTQGQVSKRSYFDIWHFWKAYCWLNKAHMRTWASEPEPEPPEPVHFARSRSRRKVLLGAGAGAGADQKCHSSASLVGTLWSRIGASARQGPAETAKGPSYIPLWSDQGIWNTTYKGRQISLNLHLKRH